MSPFATWAGALALAVWLTVLLVTKPFGVVKAAAGLAVVSGAAAIAFGVRTGSRASPRLEDMVGDLGSETGLVLVAAGAVLIAIGGLLSLVARKARP